MQMQDVELFEKIVKFDELYDKVFDSDGNRRLCGRDNCIALIEHTKVLYKESGFGDEYFGDTKTGKMNDIAIKMFKSYLREV